MHTILSWRPLVLTEPEINNWHRHHDPAETEELADARAATAGSGGGGACGRASLAAVAVVVHPLGRGPSYKGRSRDAVAQSSHRRESKPRD